MTLFTKSEPTSDEFRKIADIVAEELSLTEHYVDLWFDYQIWKHREYLEGGVCRYLGPWRSKALAIGGSYFDAAGCTSLKQIDAIPLAYFANINIEKQLPVINEILIPYLFHFQTSRTPPKLHFFSVFDPQVEKGAGHRYIDIELVNDKKPGFEVATTALLRGLFYVRGFRSSTPPDFVLKSEQYTLITFELVLAHLW